MPSRTYRLILRCFPRDLRARHAAAMAAQFDEQRRLTSGRPVARVALWIRAMTDAARHGFALRFGSQRPPGRLSPIPGDVRQAWRSLRARPGHAFVSIGLLAIALSVSTAVFAIVDATLLTPLPFPDAPALVSVLGAPAPHHPDAPSMPVELARLWFAQTPLFSSIGGYQQGGSALVGGGGTTVEDVGLAYVTPSLFTTLGVAPVAGRTFVDGEGAPGRDRVVVISDSIWRGRFNRDRAAIGRTLLVNDVPREIVGVMPASFAFPYGAIKLWLPFDVGAAPAGRTLEVVARSRFGGNHAVLDDRVAAIAPGIMSQSVRSSRYPTAAVRGLGDLSFLGPRTRQSIVVLGWATFLLLLTAGANLSSLTMSQVLARTRHMAIQSALGASRLRLIRQALIEQVLIGVSGVAVAAPLAWLSIQLAMNLGPTTLTKWTNHIVAFDARSVFVLGALALATPLVTGLVPALAGSRTSVVEILKQDARASAGSRASRALRRALVIAEIVCAVVLLVGGALLVRSFLRLQAVDRGFDTRSLVYAQVRFPSSAFPSPLSRRSFADRAVESLAAAPGVQAAVLTVGVPPQDGQISFGTVQLDGQTTPRNIDLPEYLVRPEFFAVTGIPIRQGRPFGAEEAKTSAIVSESFAAAMWPGRSPLGHRFRLSDRGDWREVVGVAGEVRSEGLEDARASFEAYYPYVRQPVSAIASTPEKTDAAYSGSASFVIRSAHADAVLSSVRAALQSVDARATIDHLQTVESLYQETLSEPRMLLVLMAIFSAAGLLVAGVGVYGVLSNLVTQQLREIGVRLMLGAEPVTMARRVFRGGLGLSATGVVVGLAIAVLFGRLMSSVLFDVRTTDLASYVSVIVVVAIATLAAAWLPARRAANADPAALLRDN